LSNFEFPTPRIVPTELEETISIFQNIYEIVRQERILEDLNTTFPNNEEQQDAYNYIRNSTDEFKKLNGIYEEFIDSTLLAGLI
jgi:hypothetical protein